MQCISVVQQPRTHQHAELLLQRKIRPDFALPPCRCSAVYFILSQDGATKSLRSLRFKGTSTLDVRKGAMFIRLKQRCCTRMCFNLYTKFQAPRTVGVHQFTRPSKSFANAAAKLFCWETEPADGRHGDLSSEASKCVVKRKIK